MGCRNVTFIFSQALSILAVAFIASCGLEFGFPRPGTNGMGTQSGIQYFSEGYYVAVSDAGSKDYPLIVIKRSNEKLRTFQLSRISVQPVFWVGSETSQLSTDVLATRATKGLDFEYIGTLRLEGNHLRLVSRKYKEADKNLPQYPEVGEVMLDYLLKRVTRDECIAVLRTLQPLPKETVFSAVEQEVCGAAFDLSCVDVYFSTRFR
jgi:hypothetical protein